MFGNLGLEMNDQVRQTLRNLVDARGTLCDPTERGRLEGLLKDHCKDSRKEIFLLVAAHKDGVPGALQQALQQAHFFAAETPETAVARLAVRLCENTAIEIASAQWAVETWALALRTIPDPVVQQKTSATVVQQKTPATVVQEPPPVVPEGQAVGKPASRWFIYVAAAAVLGCVAIVAALKPFLSPGDIPESTNTESTSPAVDTSTPPAEISSIVPDGAGPDFKDSLQTYVSKLQEMITLSSKASSTENESAIRQEADDLSKLPRPRRGQRKTARHLNDVARDKINGQDFAGAINTLKLAYDADPADVEIVNNLAYAMMKVGDLAGAEQHLFVALAIVPDRADAWFNLAQTYALREDETKALACFANSYRFSHQPDQVRQLLQQLSQEDSHDEVRRIAQAALNTWPILSTTVPPTDSTH